MKRGAYDGRVFLTPYFSHVGFEPVPHPDALHNDHKFEVACGFELHNPGEIEGRVLLERSYKKFSQAYDLCGEGDVIVRNIIPGRFDVIEIAPENGASLTGICRREDAQTQDKIVKSTVEKVVMLLDGVVCRCWFKPHRSTWSETMRELLANAEAQEEQRKRCLIYTIRCV